MSQSEIVKRSSNKWSVNVLVFLSINLVFGCGNMENTNSKIVEVEESPFEGVANEIEETPIEGQANFDEYYKDSQPWHVGIKTRLGGIVVFEKNGAGIVVAPSEWDYMSWYKASKLADTLVLNGYEDWRLPSLGEMELIFQNVAKLRNIDMETGYWTNETVGSEKVIFDLYNGGWRWENKSFNSGALLLVRTFGDFQLNSRALIDENAAAE